MPEIIFGTTESTHSFVTPKNKPSALTTLGDIIKEDVSIFNSDLYPKHK